MVKRKDPERSPGVAWQRQQAAGSLFLGGLIGDQQMHILHIMCLFVYLCF